MKPEDKSRTLMCCQQSACWPPVLSVTGLTQRGGDLWKVSSSWNQSAWKV